MLFSTSNAILVTALALNVASTFGAPFPGGSTGNVDARAPKGELNSRYIDILVPKKRFRAWNKTRRAARENALKAIRHAESRAAAIDVDGQGLNVAVEEPRELAPQIGRRHPTPYSADDLLERDLDDELEARHSNHKKTKGKGKKTGKGKINKLQSTTVSLNMGHAGGMGLGGIMGHGGGHGGGGQGEGGMCPCPNSPPPGQCQQNPGTPAPGQPGSAPLPGQPGSAPLPGQPGSGTDGPGSPGSPSMSIPVDEPLPSESAPDGSSPTDSVPVDGPSPSDSASGSTPTDLPDGGNSTIPSASDSASTPIETGTGEGDGGDGGEDGGASASAGPSDAVSSDAVPSASDSASVPSESGTPDGTTPPDDGTTPPDPSGGDNSTETTDPPTTDSPDESAPEGRSLFERWLSGRTEPVRRVDSARFRLR
ncbi:hypothetical protein C8R43DRAFT_1122884 [Mycena crocata]|nr:hypothetical protein C8R43DRAFT_1122884 [Mycena crocata]